MAAAAHFLTTYDSSSMWASEGICTDGACVAEHAPVATLDAARFHVGTYSNALIGTVVGATFGAAQGSISRLSSACAESASVARKAQVVVRFDAFSTGRPATATYVAPRIFAQYEALRKRKIEQLLPFLPEDLLNIILHYEGLQRESIQRIGVDFFQIFNRRTPDRPIDFEGRLALVPKRLASAKVPTGWTAYSPLPAVSVNAADGSAKETSASESQSSSAVEVNTAANKA